MAVLKTIVQSPNSKTGLLINGTRYFLENYRAELNGNIVSIYTVPRSAESFSGNLTEIEIGDNTYPNDPAGALVALEAIGVGFNKGSVNPPTPVESITVYQDTGTANNIVLTIPDYVPKEGDMLYFRAAVSNTSPTINLNLNATGNARFYATATNSNMEIGTLRVGGIYKILYTNGYWVLVDYQGAIPGNAVTATIAATTDNAQYGCNAVATTYFTNKTSQEGKYLMLGTFTTTHSTTYVDGKNINLKLNLNELKRGNNVTTDLEDFQINVIIAGGSYVAANWLTYAPDIKITVKGKLIDTKPEDIILVQTTNSSTTKTWTLYIKANIADKMFAMLPENRLGRGFSPTTVYFTASTGGIYFNFSNNIDPIATLPLPVQGDYNYATQLTTIEMLINRLHELGINV